MKMQKIKLSGRSDVTLVDALLGGAAGFGVPFVAEKLIQRSTYAAEHPWLMDYAGQWSAVAGIVAAVPLYFVRGMAPALIAVSTAVMFGGFRLVEGWINGSDSGDEPVLPDGTTELGRLRAAQMGRIRSLPGARTRTGAVRVSAGGRSLPVRGSGTTMGRVAAATSAMGKAPF